jgi:L-rhamnose mutarotase
MRRFGQLIGLKRDQIEAYERLHAAVWPEVLAMISACNMCNYSIFRHDELLFAYCQSPYPPRGKSSYPNSTAIRHTC